MDNKANIELIALFGKMIGLSNNDMAKAAQKCEQSAPNTETGENIVEEIMMCSAATKDKEAMFIGAMLYSYLISGFLDD